MTPEDLLRRAIALSAAAMESGNPPFGSLLADADGNILAEDHNTSVTDNDITDRRQHPPQLRRTSIAASVTDYIMALLEKQTRRRKA